MITPDPLNSKILPALVVVLVVFLSLPGLVYADEEVSAAQVLQIDFSANVTAGFSPFTVLFTDISTIPGTVYDRTWYMGDGTVVSSGPESIVHTYMNAGTFTVQMDRSDDEGYHSRIKYNYITVENPIPTVTPTATPPTPTPSPTVSPTLSPTTTPTGSPTTVPTTVPTTALPSIPPADFYGNAFVQGSAVPSGSTIQARIDQRTAGSITLTSPGTYGGPGPFDSRLSVYATEEESESGSAVITFWLDGSSVAPQTAVFQSGSVQQLDLAFPGFPPTTVPTTVPTTSPTSSPTATPTTPAPTQTATGRPTGSPTTTVPTTSPTTAPATTLTTVPTTSPTGSPTATPTTPAPTQTATGRPTTSTVSPTPTIAPDMQIGLSPGWNFIAFPRVLAPGGDTGSIFAGIDTQGHSIYYYNASSTFWERVTYSTPLRPLNGIWIYSATTKVVPLSFSSQQGLIQSKVYTGWNSFGIPNLTAVPARDALAPLHRQWNRAIGFDPATQLYETTIVIDGSGKHNDTVPLQPTKGYWIYMTGNVTYQAFIPPA